jgi:hypothetical protein
MTQLTKTKYNNGILLEHQENGDWLINLGYNRAAELTHKEFCQLLRESGVTPGMLVRPRPAHLCSCGNNSGLKLDSIPQICGDCGKPFDDRRVPA